jgi:hypothetical protein
MDFGIILHQIAAPNQYLRSICAKNVCQIVFELLFCAKIFRKYTLKFTLAVIFL